VIRNPHGDGVEVRGREIAEANRRLWQHKRERSRPEGARQPRGGVVEVRERLGRCKVLNVCNERTGPRASRGSVKPRNRFLIRRIGAETVDCLGGKRHQPAAGEAPSGGAACGGVGLG
jgi:hypothetical protein